MNKALVLFSGGQDSTTCLAEALQKYPNQVEALAISYGQRHNIELEQAKIIANKANVPLQILDLSLIGDITINALTDESIKIEQKEGELPSTFVDGRNHLFLSYAAIIAKSKGIQKIYTGVCETDYSGYPDCRDEFIKSLNKTLNLAMDYKFDIITPLMWLSKAETVQKMKQLGKLDWYKDTHTCYEGKRPACGECLSCKLRIKGFKEAKIKDPLLYNIEIDWI